MPQKISLWKFSGLVVNPLPGAYKPGRLPCHLLIIILLFVCLFFVFFVCFLNFILFFFIQQVLISYLFHTYQCIYVNPILHGKLWILSEVGIQDKKLLSLWSFLLLFAQLSAYQAFPWEIQGRSGTHINYFRGLATSLGRVLGGEVLVEDINCKGLG